MDQLGYRLKMGSMGPSTNTIVQPDYDDLRPRGVTNHYSRILVPNAGVGSDSDFVRLIDQIRINTLDALDALKSAEVQYIAMGMSATTFWNGREAAEAYHRELQERAEVGVSFGSFAVEAALRAYGAKRIAFLSPYFPIANTHVRRFFEDSGFQVVRDVCLRCASPVLIAHADQAQCRASIRELDGDDVDAIVQVGTNLSMIRLAAAAELYLGKPVIAINTATYWHALRAAGISDQVDGFGALLAKH